MHYSGPLDDDGADAVTKITFNMVRGNAYRIPSFRSYTIVGIVLLR